MYGTGFAFILVILTSVCPNVWSTGVIPVRLNGGSSPREGRIEVFHEGEWGTVCDDKFTNKVCIVLCKQLGYGSESICINAEGDGGCQKNDGSIYGDANAKIWLDELICDGPESSIDECQKTNWNVTDCGHKEDAGCICIQNTSGSCDKARHRISPLDPSNPVMGRVEIQDDNNNWGLVCNDDWDDVDARVFCDCLGYKDRHLFRALLYPKHISSLPMLYSAVHCKSPQDTASTKNLWDCDVVKDDRRQCDPNMKAAGVICGVQPAWEAPAIPNVNMSCHGQLWKACFEPQPHVTERNYSLIPNCSYATIKKKGDGRVCIRVNMSSCEASHTKSNVSTKQYCHDVKFSSQNESSVELLTGPTWTRRLCCKSTKNGTAVSSFVPKMVAPPAVYKENSEVNNFTMTCYKGDEKEDSEALRFPATVHRGEPVSCFVGVRTWDEKLNMVVSDCKFMAALNNSGPPFPFIFFRDKCQTTDDLGLIFYNTDQSHWGFRFNVPKFPNYDELYVSCDVYLCDMEQETKPYCDRSCSATAMATATTADTATNAHAVDPPVQKKKRMVGNGQHSGNSGSTNHENGHIEHGPFLVEDDGFGPLINDLGQLVLVAAARKSDVHPGKGSLYKIKKAENTISAMQRGHATQLVASLWIFTSISFLF